MIINEYVTKKGLWALLDIRFHGGKKTTTTTTKLNFKILCISHLIFVCNFYNFRQNKLILSPSARKFVAVFSIFECLLVAVIESTIDRRVKIQKSIQNFEFIVEISGMRLQLLFSICGEKTTRSSAVVM